MNDIDIMEQNLARMLNEHLSQPSLDTTEPTDPFQKRTFGKKLRKSAVSAADQPRTVSLPKLDEAVLRNIKQQPMQLVVQDEQDEEAEMYMREVEVLMARLKVGLERVEENCRERLQRICAANNGRQRQQKAEAVLSELEASIDFITNDCFNFDGKCSKDKENRQDKDNREIREIREIREKPEKQIKRNSMVSSKVIKPTQKHEKSIYESVLEERKLRRSKKRMI